MEEGYKYVDLTYGGKLKGTINVIEDKTFDMLYTIKGDTGEVTTTSILINDGGENMKDYLMITFDYQELKELVGDK